MSAIFDSIKVTGEVRRFVDHSFDIVDQIFEILGRQGKTQRDLAKMLGKKESEISKWMQGTHNFTIKSIAKIEDALGEPIILTPRKVSRRTEFIPVYVQTSRQKHVVSESIEGGKWSRKSNVISKNGVLKVA